MTSSLPPQEPPTQNPQSDVKGSEERRPGRINPIRRFLRNLLLPLLFPYETQAEAKKQIRDTVNRIIEKSNLAGKLDENIQGLNKTYKKKHNKEYRRNKRLYRGQLRKLTRQVEVVLILIAALGAILTVSAGSLLPNMLSLDVFKADLKRLGEEIEVLKEDPQNN